MKKLILLLSTIVLGIFTLQSCKEDECVVETTDIKLDKKELSLTAKGQNGMVKVLAGEGTFEATDFDTNIIKVMVAGKNITVVPLEAGNTEVTITNSFKEATFKVTVQAPDIAIAKTKAELKEGEMTEIAITNGSGKYSASVDNENATAEVKDGKVVIKGVKNGTAKVTVKDNETGKTAIIEVTIIQAIKDIAIEKTSVEVTEGQNAEIAITAGSGEYTTTVDNANVTAEVKDGKVIIKGAKAGTTKVTITDTKTNKTAVVVVTITVAPEITFDKLYTDWEGNQTTKGGLTFIVGDSEENRTITIVKGTAPFTVKDKNADSSWKKAKSTFEVKDNKIIFTADKFASDEFVVTDANGKTNEIEVNVRKALEVKIKGADADKIEVLVGQTIDKTEDFRVEGLVSRITLTNSKTDVVEAKIKDGNNTAKRNVVLKGLKVGTSVLTITDGVVTKTITVTVKEPSAMKVYKEDGTTELNGNDTYDLGKFMIKGGTGDFEVTTTSNLIVTPIEKPTKGFSSGNFEFELKRNTNVAQGGEATITVKDKNGKKFTFKVNCPTLLEATFEVGGNALPKQDSGDERRYTIVTGMFAGYNIQNIAVGDVITVTIANGSGSYKVENLDGKGNVQTSDEIEIIPNGDNKTFTIKAKKKANYYGTIVITDKKDPKKVIKITRIYITKDGAGTGTYEDLAVEKATVEVKEGGTQSVTVAGGSLKYTVESADKKVATAEIKDGKVVVTGVKAGEVKVTVTDTKTKKTAEITVTVTAKNATTDDVAVDEATKEVKVGEKVEVTITKGSGKYDLTADNRDATAELKDNKIIITGVKAGTTKITVTDTETKKTVVVTITIVENAPEIAVAEENVTVANGAKKEVEITAGTPPYTVTSADDKKVAATIKDTNKVEITGKADNGTVVLTVTDANSKTKTITVTLATAPEITFDKVGKDWQGNIQGKVKFVFGDADAEHRSITITDGTPPYVLIPKYTYASAKPKTTANITNLRAEKFKDKYGEYDVKGAGDVQGNKITFESTVEYASDEYILRDAAGKEKVISVKVVRPLEVLDGIAVVFVGQTINDMDKLQVKGYAEKIRIKSNSNPTVVEASIEQSNNKTYRAVILKGLAVGNSTLTITDGVVDKTVEIIVKNPDPITVHKEDGTELDTTTAYELGKFIIKGGIGAYEITFNSDLIKKTVKVSEVNYGYNAGNHEFTLKRNVQVAQGGVVEVTVTNKNDANDTKTFKVNCPTLLEMTLKVNGNPIPKAESGSGAYYKIVSTGSWADGYNVLGIKVGDKIEFTVNNGSGTYTVERTGYGKDNNGIEITQNGNKFTITVKSKEFSYGNIEVKDTADSTKVLKISKIEVTE